MRQLDWLHRWTGGLIGLVLAMLGLSGTVLLHRDAWIMLPHAHDTQVADNAAVVGALEAIMADPHSRPGSVLFATQSLGLNRLTYADGSGAYTDQSGAVVSRWDTVWGRPELFLFDLHHHLLAGDTGEWLIGLAGLCGLFFVLSGLVLWWRTRRTFRFRLLPSRLTRPAILWHHRDMGVVLAPLLLLAIFTGTSMIFRPVAALVLGPSAPATIGAALKAPEPAPTPLADQPDWRQIVRTARQLFPDAEIRLISLPKQDGGPITMRMKQPEEWLPNGRTMLWFASDTGRLIEARNALLLPSQVQWFNTFYPLHAAKVGGLPYRLVMTLVGLALTLLGSLTVWTFWFRRRPSTRHAESRRPVTVE
ncbi:pepSY-associated TM helix family protein [Blastomonas sp. RAC04]|uniref:PepSY-associated TM helix domain-containing protein n=1 Tax=Blastomonas sp. RAC04 TaxID=1842535 RepID=UPI00083CF7C4|nr:PepSY-associated TM helix domain-containing protein [Blastomonas sp. RAC04]AOG02412.1 pepSY-associated TM helix family protein [Blastomonas sp. RAC04]